MTPHAKRRFQRTVLAAYKKSGRAFPWRSTKNPYRIFISELMLQQTQTARVLGAYRRWFALFPDISTLAQASLREVLAAWQGLGYNRRALALHRTAKIILSRHGGKIPEDREALLSLPGVGPYTAGAIRAFAFGKADVFIETNIRAVYLSYFFSSRRKVSDKEILPLIARTLYTPNPRLWYYALMDAGVAIKKHSPGLNSKNKAYRRQSKFKGSEREVRGALIRHLSRTGQSSLPLILESLPFPAARIARSLGQLAAEGFLTQSCHKISLT